MPSRGDVEHEKWQPLFNGASAFHSFEIGGPLTFLEVIFEYEKPRRAFQAKREAFRGVD